MRIVRQAMEYLFRPE